MTAETLSVLIDQTPDNRVMRLLADTTFAMRADPAFVQRADDLAGAVFLEEEEPAALAPDSLNLVLGRIERAAALDATAEAAGAKDKLAAEVARLPSPVREAALEAMAERRWGFAGIGIKRLSLFTDGDEQAELFRIEPGRGVSEHDHEDDELTLVLTGAYNDGQAAYRPGDVSLARPGFSHSPSAEPGEVCYVLVAVRGAPKFSGAMGLAQRLTGYPARLTKPGQ